MPVDVQIMGAAKEHPRIESLVQRIRQNPEKIFRALGLLDPEVSVVLTDDEQIRALNAQWRGEDQATDVLSFPLYEPEDLPEEPLAIGDIIISVPFAEQTALSKKHHRRLAQEMDLEPESFEWTLDDEVAFLYIHGLLHLLGYDHGDPDDEAEMRRQEYHLWRLTRQNEHPE